MCNSASLTAKQQKLEEHYRAKMAVPLLFEPYYHIAAYTFPNLFIIKQNEPDTIFPASWGFMPEHIKADPYHYRRRWKRWNARVEKLFDHDSVYPDYIRNKRCLILADGFFEPHYYPGEKRAYPFYCYQPENGGRKLFSFAGMYSEIDDEVLSCTIITTKANAQFSEIHNRAKRMPLVLEPTFENEWLKQEINDTGLKELLKHGFTKEEFKAHPVSRNLFKKDIDTNTPAIVEPIEPPLTLF